MKYPMKCPECGFTEEAEGPIQDGPPATACFPCSIFGTGGMVWMRRVFSAPATIFRGGGWASKS